MEAYECGKRDRLNGIPQAAGLLSFFRTTNDRADVVELRDKIEIRYTYLSRALGARRLLLDKLMSALRKQYGCLLYTSIGSPRLDEFTGIGFPCPFYNFQIYPSYTRFYPPSLSKAEAW